MKITVTTEGESEEILSPVIRATSVVEQRVSHFSMGLGLIGTMTGPLLLALHTIPRAIFCGVFFVVGVSLNSTNLVSHSVLYESNVAFNTNSGVRLRAMA